MATLAEIILDGRDPLDWTPVDDDLARDMASTFDPLVGSGSAQDDSADECDAPEDFDSAFFTFDPFVVA